MATFILLGNPDISSYSLGYHRRFLETRPKNYELNWSVWEHDKAHEGDEFYMVCCKKRPAEGKTYPDGRPVWESYADSTTGICMIGHLSSAPYGGEDWSGKGRPTYYMNRDIERVTDPSDCVILDTEELKAVTPAVSWTTIRFGYCARSSKRP